MIDIFLYLALALAVLDWFAVARGLKRMEYIAKPGTMLALLAWFFAQGGLSGHAVWFGVGLFLSLCGDVFLMLPKEQFIAGLVSFLLAHIAYLVGFNQTLPALNAPGILLGVMIGLTASRLYRGISAGLQKSNQTRLLGPVLAYSAVISLMLLSALLTLVRPEWQAGAAMFVSGGALLFFFSDTILAWNKFVAPVNHGRLINMVTYHLGQFMIAYGAYLQFTGEGGGTSILERIFT